MKGGERAVRLTKERLWRPQRFWRGKKKKRKEEEVVAKLKT